MLKPAVVNSSDSRQLVVALKVLVAEPQPLLAVSAITPLPVPQSSVRLFELPPPATYDATGADG